ncbi:10254_t:CDS:1, partial [Scutellospora calospora]
QSYDSTFYRILEDVRTRNLLSTTLQMIEEKVRNSFLYSTTDTTYIVRFRAMADKINKLSCSSLPLGPEELDPTVLIAIDHINSQEYDLYDNNHIFHNQTNLPSTLILQQEAYVMYLNNLLFEHRLCNSSIGVVTDIIDENTIKVVFPILQTIITAT